MQTIASQVTVLDKAGETKEYVAPTILLHDFGLFVKNDSGLTLYNWDRVKEIQWAEPSTINQVWGLAVAQLASDLDLDDEEYMWDDEEDPYATIETGKPDETTPTSSESDAGKTSEVEEKKDDNPYA
ncbi:hypothetical protein N9N26_00810 [Candidatus Poseidoniales archaeon]|nr:hypothetical protein [Candidatus Poseidoniales archaeon]